jgi:caffeoyl-CoA O-methyltransferase
MAEKSFLDPKLEHYVADHSVREPDVLRRLREETASHPMAIMQIAPSQGQLFDLLIRATAAKNVLEVGVFTGYSSLRVALALPDDGRIVACDVSEEFTSVARRYWQEAGVVHKIDLRIAPATETLRALLAEGREGAFDYAFIDADKTNYDNYYEAALRLVRPGGTIVLDNMLQSGNVIDPANQEPNTLAIRALNAKIAADDRVIACLLPIADGVTLAVRR